MCVLSHFRHVRLFRPYDCSPPGSSVHGILQAKILGWVAVPSSRGSSWPRDRTCLLYLLHWQAGSLPLSPPGKPTNQDIHSEINIEREKQLVRWYIPKKKSRINCPSYTFKTYMFLRTYCPLISMHIKNIRNILRIQDVCILKLWILLNSY